MVVNRTKARLGQQAVWASADPQFRYFAVASALADSAEQVINLIDLQPFKNTPVLVEMQADEEVHPYVGERPLTLFVGLGGVMQSYKVANLIRQGSSTPTSETAIDLGAHGLVLAQDQPSRHFYQGGVQRRGYRLCRVGLQGMFHLEYSLGPRWPCWGSELPAASGLRWDHRARGDAGPVATPAQWADTPQDIHVLNLRTLKAHRFRLGNGIVPRFALSQAFAVFVTVHPYGDELHLLDVRPQSPTYLKRTAPWTSHH